MSAEATAIDAGSFDYIVAGAGSAGCAVAARLSENGRYRVLLLEDGGEDRGFWIHVPIGYSRLFANRRINWMFESEPEPELEGRTMYQPRGKVLGASSINGMVYMRGNPADYDLWRQRGCAGWSRDSVLPISKRPRTRSAGRAKPTAAAGRCAFPTRRSAGNWVIAS
jgi:choline dehydrogenase